MKAVLFDLDGTLVNTIEDITHAMNTVLRGYGLPEHSSEKYKEMVGWGSRVLVEKALPDGDHSDRFIDECLHTLDTYYHKNPVIYSQPYPNIVSLLRSLRDSQITFGVYSNKTDPIVHSVIERLFTYEWFSVVRGAVPDKPTKPDPTVALELAAEMGFDPSEIIYVGDSDIDIYTAKSAGMVAAGATWGFRPKEVLQQAGAEHLLNNPLELKNYVSI